jgi:hypothetical protein
MTMAVMSSTMGDKDSHLLRAVVVNTVAASATSQGAEGPPFFFQYVRRALYVFKYYYRGGVCGNGNRDKSYIVWFNIHSKGTMQRKEMWWWWGRYLYLKYV